MIGNSQGENGDFPGLGGMDFPDGLASCCSELSSIVGLANAIAAWLDIHLRERSRSFGHED